MDFGEKLSLKVGTTTVKMGQKMSIKRKRVEGEASSGVWAIVVVDFKKDESSLDFLIKTQVVEFVLKDVEEVCIALKAI